MDQLREQILAAIADKRRLRIRGAGSKDWYGRTPQGDILDTRACSGIVSYEPAELVITVRSGTPLHEVEAALAERGQMLAFEPPHFGGATIGGAIASGLSGPGRAARGAVRDFVLGTAMLDGRGQFLRFGGQVMKNVAGYDLTRLMAGSMGTMGLMLEHSIKVLPKPQHESTHEFDCSEIEALRCMNEWAGQAIPITASCWHADKLTIRLAGAAQLGGREVAGDWTALREQTHDFFKRAQEQSLFRLSVPSAAAALILRGEQLIEWGGAQRWLSTASPDDAAKVRQVVAAAGGHATQWRGKKIEQVFQPLAPAVQAINLKLMAEFDPHHVFDRARMYAD